MHKLFEAAVRKKKWKLMVYNVEFVAAISVILSWLLLFQKVNLELVSNGLMDVLEGCEQYLLGTFSTNTF